MKRKLKIITAGAAGLVLLAPIGTVIACGDPKSDDPKMLSLDKFQELMLKSKLGPNKVATEAQKASLKAIYDTFSLEKSKTFKVSSEETKEDGTKEEINVSYDIYLLSKKGDPLEVSDDGELNSYKEDPKMSSSIKEMYRSIRDNFVNEKNINKYLLSVVKYTDENGKSKSETELNKIVKNIKNDNEIVGQPINIFNKTLEDPKMLSLDKFQELMLKSKLGPDKVATEAQKTSLKAIYDTFSLEKSKTFKVSSEEIKEDGTKEGINASYDIYLLSKKGTPFEVLNNEKWDSFKEESWMSADIKEMTKGIRDNFVNEKNINKYLLLVTKYTGENGKSRSGAVLNKIMKKDNEIGGKEILIFNKTFMDPKDKLNIIFKKIEKNSESKTDIDTFEVIITNIKYPKFNDEQIQEINILAQIASANKVLGLYDREKSKHYGSMLYKFKLTIGLQLISAMEENPTKNVSKIKLNGKYLGLKAVIDNKNNSSSTKITSLLEYINRKINDEDIIHEGKTQQEMAKELMNNIRKELKMNYTEKQGLQLFNFMNLLDNTLNKTNDEKMQKLYNKISSFEK